MTESNKFAYQSLWRQGLYKLSSISEGSSYGAKNVKDAGKEPSLLGCEKEGTGKGNRGKVTIQKRRWLKTK